MQKNIYLPNVELNMEGVTVTQWLVNVGDRVEAEQDILEVETQKAVIEVPCPDAGYVRALYAETGDDVAERALLCILTDEEDEDFSDPRQDASSTTAEEEIRHQNVQPTESVALASNSSGIAPAAPAARKLASELGIDLSQVKGTGPANRITVEDVKAAQSSSPSNDGEDWRPLPASRIALNRQMQKSLAEIPQIHVARQMNVTPLTQKQEGITFTHRLVKAAAASLQKHPALHTIIEGERVKVEPVSVAIALDTPHGLVAPALRNADELSLEQVAATVRDFAERGKDNSLKREELSNAPFAITNLGMLGIDFFQAFVFYGQTAVLAVGQAMDGSEGIKSAWFNLATDHRVVDGAEAARFLATLQQEIDNS